MKTPLTTRSGEPTGAVYGFARKLLSVLKEYRPEYVATAFDAGDTWRHAEFPAYKGTRESMPDDMRPQMERIAQLVRAFNIPCLPTKTSRQMTSSVHWGEKPVSKVSMC
jgi:DNA polymerase-1